MNSADGFITYVITSPVEFNANGYIFNFLRNFATERLMDDIKGMKKIGTNNAAFDVPDDYKTEMDKIVDLVKQQEGRAKGFTLDVAKSLEDLEDPNEVIEPER